MTDAGFPSQVQTRTTVQSHTQVQPEIRYDPLYCRTVPGIIKILIIIFNLIGFICIQCSKHSYHARGEFFSTVAMIGFWFTGILLVLYIFHVLEKFYKIPWLKIELGFNAVWTVLYVIAAILAVTFPAGWYHAAAFFGFCSMFLYGYDAFTKFQIFKAGGIAQGNRTVHVQQQQTVASVQVA